jgi:hypothetical protein
MYEYIRLRDFKRYMVTTNLDPDLIINMIHKEINAIYEKGYEPKFLLLNKLAYEALAVKFNGFIELFMGLQIIYNPSQERLVEVLCDPQTQYVEFR